METDPLIETGDVERKLLDGLRAGDETLFERLVAGLHPAMIRVALTYVCDEAAAEDVVQDTWLAVIRGLDGFAGRSSLRSWIFSILLNRARTAGGRATRVVPFSSGGRADRAPAEGPDQFTPGRELEAGRWRTPSLPWSEQPEASVLARESMAGVRALIAALPPRQRDAVLARDVLGLTAVEAAALSEQSESTHRVFLHRGRHAVRAALAGLVEEER